MLLGPPAHRDGDPDAALVGGHPAPSHGAEQAEQELVRQLPTARSHRNRWCIRGGGGVVREGGRDGHTAAPTQLPRPQSGIPAGLWPRGEVSAASLAEFVKNAPLLRPTPHPKPCWGANVAKYNMPHYTELELQFTGVHR